MVKVSEVQTGFAYEAHIAGCSDLGKKAYSNLDIWTHEANTQMDVYLEHCSDFLNPANGPEMALENVYGEPRIMPCLAKHLPEGNLPTYVDYYGDAAEKVVANLVKYLGVTIAPERVGAVKVELSEFEKVVAASKAANARVFG